ncbi:MAG: STAS domain-containing protein [Betaproteobacteria bacterium]|nr:STAS domain-containing protein [Betaproteobacteria bacterium]
MIQRDGDRLRVLGEATLETAAALLGQGEALLGSGITTLDLAGVSAADSSGLAILLGLKRAARRQGVDLRIENLPANLASLAHLYGLEPILLLDAHV